MNRMPWSRRLQGVEERMDRADCPPDRLLKTVAQFRVVNRLFSRYRHILTENVIQPMRRHPERRYRLADIGAGGCDIDRWLVGQCRKENLRLEIVAVDCDPRLIRYARELNAGFPEIVGVQADALDADAWREPDFVFANHLLHHLSDEVCVAFLRRLDSLDLLGYAIGDIARSRRAAIAYAAIVAPFSHGSFLLADGLTSIRRGFTRGELQELVEQADLQRPPRIEFLFPSRCLLVAARR